MSNGALLTATAIMLTATGRHKPQDRGDSESKLLIAAARAIYYVLIEKRERERRIDDTF